MLFKIKEERPVKSLKDIRLKKQQLIHEAKKKSVKLKSRADELVTKTNPQLIFDNILEKFDLQHSLINILPLLLKYKNQIIYLNLFSGIKKSAKKRAVVIGLGSLLTGIATYLYLNRRERNN